MIGVGLAAIAAGLFAWRWYLDVRQDESRAQRGHELELRKEVVKADQDALDKSMAAVKRLEERVKTLEYRKQ